MGQVMEAVPEQSTCHCPSLSSCSGGQAEVRVDADAMQMASIEGGPQTTSQQCSQIFEVGDALRHHMIPCLGLRNIMRLAGTCREWRQLVVDSPLHHLSKQARQAVIPLGLTSSLPLLQVVKQRAQLLARLRGKHGFTPGIKRLRFRDDLLKSTSEGNAREGQCGPLLNFQSALWSPCDRLEDTSRWLALNPDGGCKRLPIVLDMETGQQVRFEEGASPMRLTAGNNPYLHAAWLMDKPTQICFYLSGGSISGSLACLADAHSQSLLPISLPRHQFSGNSQFLTVCSEEGAALDVLFWFPHSKHDPSFENQIIVFNASSRQVRYQLSCPEQLRRHFLQLQDDESSQQPPNRQQGGRLWSREVLLAPNKQLLAVVWDFGLAMDPESSPGYFERLGLSIHSAIRGDLLHSMLLRRGTDVDDNCQPGWLPCSSNFLYFSADALLHLITPSGKRLWSSAWADRHSDQFTAPAVHVIATRLSASPCGRWVLVMEGPSGVEAPRNPPGHLTVVEASTGKNLAGYDFRTSLHDLEAMWSMSGEVCLLDPLDWVLVCCQQAHPTFTTFQLYELLGSTSDPTIPILVPSLSPCGSTVIDLGNARDTGVQHWQIPQMLVMVKESASALKTLPPVVCADLTAGLQSSGNLQEAWHPWQSACIYAISYSKGGVHLIDAKANRCVQSWTEDELHGQARLTAGLEGVQRTHRHDADDSSSADDSDDEDFDVAHDIDIYPHDVYPHALSWSKDGCRLAVASKTSLTRGARCCVLCF